MEDNLLLVEGSFFRLDLFELAEEVEEDLPVIFAHGEDTQLAEDLDEVGGVDEGMVDLIEVIVTNGEDIAVELRRSVVLARFEFKVNA